MGQEYTGKTIIRVLIGQHKYEIDKDIKTKKGSADVTKNGEWQMQKVDVNALKPEEAAARYFKLSEDGHNWERPKVGGVLEDNVHEVLGFVFQPDLYDKHGNRKPEHYAPYDWTKSIGEETLR